MPGSSKHPFFPVSLNLEGRTCVVIGAADDREAIEKARALRESGANVRWITQPATLRDEDVTDAYFVISTPQDEGLSARLRDLADRNAFLLCCIDQPKFGFVAMAAIAKAGPVRIAISTTGLAPRVGKNLRDALQRVMDAKFARFIACLGTQKTRVKARYPAPESSGIRRKAMIEAASGFDADIEFRYPQWFEDEIDALLPHAVEKR
ncbi:MAG: NAD(P)-dependent oxidoreductase [Candidatus Baltobacteraceae bacterium]